MKERRAGGLGRANSFWEKKGTESPELREGKEVVGGAGGHFSRSIPKGGPPSPPFRPIIDRDLTSAEGSLLTKPPTGEASRQKSVARKKRRGSEAVYEALLPPL
ncbi:hypothetical protein MRB53_037221 [Persea americana]|nr:hypothetical protein MRB53_037221 [Persea americana]